MEFEGIVIRRTIYKGDDVMINVLTKNKMESFLAKGVLKLTSKNAPSTNLFTYSKFQIFKGKEGHFLRVGEIIKSYSNLNNTLEKSLLLDFISEITNNLLDQKDSNLTFDFLKETLMCFDEGFSPWTATLIYFAKVLIAAGYAFNVDSCSHCGAKENIVSYSIKQGGFICKKCSGLEDEKTEVRNLKILRYIFKVDIDNFKKVEFSKEEAKTILLKLIDFLNWNAQLELKSINLIKNL